MSITNVLTFKTSDPTLIDARGPRFGAVITTLVLTAFLATEVTVLLHLQLLVFALGAFFGLKYSPYGFIYSKLVKPRLRGDVPVVSYLSGGLDSTVVLGLTKHVRGKAVPSFTIGFDKAGPDERTSATESASVLGSKLTTLTLNRRDLADALADIARGANGGRGRFAGPCFSCAVRTVCTGKNAA